MGVRISLRNPYWKSSQRSILDRTDLTLPPGVELIWITNGGSVVLSNNYTLTTIKEWELTKENNWQKLPANRSQYPQSAKCGVDKKVRDTSAKRIALLKNPAESAECGAMKKTRSECGAMCEISAIALRTAKFSAESALRRHIPACGETRWAHSWLLRKTPF